MYYQEDFDGRPKQIEQVGYEKKECSMYVLGRNRVTTAGQDSRTKLPE